jgi:hypothetical protein
VSIAELERMLEGWPTKWTPVLEDGEFVGFDHNLNELEADGLIAFGDDYDKTLAEFLATMVNAMPALLGVAKATMELVADWRRVSDPLLDRNRVIALEKALLAALTKVSV